MYIPKIGTRAQFIRKKGHLDEKEQLVFKDSAFCLWKIKTTTPIFKLKRKKGNKLTFAK